MTTIAALLADKAAERPDAPLFLLPASVQALWGAKACWSYGEVQAEVARLASDFAAAGYGPGHRVALLLENRPEHFLHWLALNSLGISAVPLNPDGSAEEFGYVLGHSGAVLAIALEARAGHVRSAAASLGLPVIGPGEVPPPAPAAPGGQTGEEAEAALVYTSGTTGKPKGCILSNLYFLNWGRWYAAQGGAISLRPWAERLMTPLPAFHVNASGHSFMGMLTTGGAQIIVDRFHPRNWWHEAAETGATCFHYLGVMPAILLELPEGPEDRAHGLRFGLGGGVHPDHHAVFEARYGVPLLEGWAMTETGGACVLCAWEEPRVLGSRCIGNPARPGPAMEARVVDDTGADVPDGTPGELWVRASGDDPRRGLFSGYLKNPEATAEAWADGWFHTGDVVIRDAAGRLYFNDRKKNIIRRSGENIAAIEVEGAVASCAGVAQVAVVAMPEPLRGEEVLAVIVPKAGQDEAALAQAVFDRCATQLSYFKVPGVVVFVDSLPTTSTQKLRRADLGALAEAPLAAPRGHDLRARKQGLRARSDQ